MKNVLTFLLLTVCFGCDPSLMLPDPIDPRLPKFTESGNNVGGALINDEVWISEVENHLFGGGLSNAPRLEVYQQQDSTVLQFHGLMQGRGVTINFIFNHFSFEENHLETLAGPVLMVDGENVIAEIEELNSEQCDITGQILFTKFEDRFRFEHGILCSGTFGLFTDSSCSAPINVTYGRFDFEVHPHFY